MLRPPSAPLSLYRHNRNGGIVVVAGKFTKGQESDRRGCSVDIGVPSIRICSVTNESRLARFQSVTPAALISRSWPGARARMLLTSSVAQMDRRGMRFLPRRRAWQCSCALWPNDRSGVGPSGVGRPGYWSAPDVREEGLGSRTVAYGA